MGADSEPARSPGVVGSFADYGQRLGRRRLLAGCRSLTPWSSLGPALGSGTGERYCVASRRPEHSTAFGNDAAGALEPLRIGAGSPPLMRTRAASKRRSSPSNCAMRSARFRPGKPNVLPALPGRARLRRDRSATERVRRRRQRTPAPGREELRRLLAHGLDVGAIAEGGSRSPSR